MLQRSCFITRRIFLLLAVSRTFLFDASTCTYVEAAAACSNNITSSNQLAKAIAAATAQIDPSKRTITLCPGTRVLVSKSIRANLTRPVTITCAQPKSCLVKPKPLLKNVTGTTTSTTTTSTSYYKGNFMTIVKGSLTIQGLAISNFTTAFSGNGAAFDLQSSSKLTVSDCLFDSNTARQGGAIYATDSKLVIVNSSFTKNTAPSSGLGGAIATSGKCSLSVSGSFFQKNTATFHGAIAMNHEGSATFEKTVFKNNSASYYGGALYSGFNATTKIGRGCRFLNNDVYNYGGAIYADGKLSLVSSTVFQGNTAQLQCDDVYKRDDNLEFVCRPQDFPDIVGAVDTFQELLTAIHDAGANPSGGEQVISLSPGAYLVPDDMLRMDLTLANPVVVSCTTPRACIIKPSNAYGDHVFILNGGSLTLDGVVITQFAGTTLSTGPAAVFRVVPGSMLALNNCVLDSNSKNSGSVIHATQGSIDLNSCDFVNNRGNTIGGAIFTSGSQIRIANCLFRNNTCRESGGALYVSGGSISIETTTFQSNSAGTLGGGGAIYYYSEFTGLSPIGFRVSSSSFENNTSGSLGSGGAIDLYFTDPSTATIATTHFRGNAAHDGGALSMSGDATAVTIDVGSKFESNSAYLLGGAIYVGPGDTAPVNFAYDPGTVFSGNSAASSCDDIYVFTLSGRSACLP